MPFIRRRRGWEIPEHLATPWKYGFKSAKAIVKIEFIEKEPETFWHKVAPLEYGFVANVDPDKPHPRWSQAMETIIGINKQVKTQKYNGYGEYVAKLYE
jgi:sulfoxide reductase catalytic subunit YedY